MSNDCKISKISSEYCFKSIFTYIKLNTVLKLVKYNKGLQKKLDINIKDYSLDYDLKVIKNKNHNSPYKETSDLIIILLLLFEMIFPIYQIIFSLIYITKKPGVEEKIENIEKYFQESFGKSIIYKRLQKLEISILVLSLRIFFFCFIIYKKRWLKLIFFMEIIYQTIIHGFEIWFLWEIYYIYENKKSNWVVRNLLAMIIIFSIFFIISIALCILKILIVFDIIETIFIIKFKGIEINDLKIDDNFSKKNPAEKKRCILNKTEEMIVKYSENEKYIFQSINKYRKENKLDDLKYVNKIPEFIVEGNSLVKYSLNNIIKIRYKKYLFKYPSGEFLSQLNVKNKNILDILSLDYLNSIKIVRIDKIEYILVYDDRNDKNDMNKLSYFDISISEGNDFNNQNESMENFKNKK